MRCALRLLLPLITLLAQPVELSSEVTDSQVGQAVKQLRQYLYSLQDPETGSWEFTSTTGGLPDEADQAGGKTALVTYALLVSGDSAQLPQLTKAIKFLQRKQVNIQGNKQREGYPLELFRGTYAVAIRAHVWSRLPPIYHAHLRADADWLVATAEKHRSGLFGYHPADTTRVDHSISQYGILGLGHAASQGVSVPQRYWQRWLDHFLDSQQADGGWSYRGADDKVTTGSMTTAGLNALLLGQQQLYRQRTTAEPKITAALNQGFSWLNQRFDGAVNHNSRHYTYYYLYGIERAAYMSGTRYLNSQDWYQAGATHIIRLLTPDGSIDSNAVRTAFSLLFLARGRYPVWINKLQVPGKHWNNCPNDLHFLSSFLSRQLEGEINWQTVDIGTDPKKWLAAPITFVASDETLTLSQQERAALKLYLDLGGMLVTSPDGGSEKFKNAMRALAADLYPHYPARRLDPNHEIFRTWSLLPQGDQPVIESVSNGARELILMSQEDLSHSLQATTTPARQPAWRLMTNLFAYVTNKGSPNNRLISPLVTRHDRPSLGTVTVGRPRYRGNWLPESATWDVMSNYVFNRSGLDVQTTPGLSLHPEEIQSILELDQLGESDHRLIHLTGTERVKLTPEQLHAIRTYVQRGGTILVETIGGRGAFCSGIETQLTEFLSTPAVPLTGFDPVISGEGLNHGYDIRRTPYRQYAVLKLNADPVPDLTAYMIENRPAILLSRNDLSLGALGVRHWNIIGYQPDTCRKIMTNILLWAHGQTLTPQTDTLPLQADEPENNPTKHQSTPSPLEPTDPIHD